MTDELASTAADNVDIGRAERRLDLGLTVSAGRALAGGVAAKDEIAAMTVKQRVRCHGTHSSINDPAATRDAADQPLVDCPRPFGSALPRCPAAHCPADPGAASTQPRLVSVAAPAAMVAGAGIGRG